MGHSIDSIVGSVAPPAAGASPAAAPAVADLPVAAADLHDAVDRINRHFDESNTSLKFSVDQQLDIVVVSVINTGSGEVLRQIPSEVALRIARDIAQDSARLQAHLLRARA